MVGCGYPIDNDELEVPIYLREFTLTCSIEELEKLIEFLSFTKETHKKALELGNYVHSHYRDWDKTWTEKQTDFIVLSVDKSGEFTKLP
jgi:hypothetical protein